MRISNHSMARSYQMGLMNAQAQHFKAMTRVYTLNRMDSMSEDVSRGLRAFTVRRQLQKNETFQENIKDALTFYTAAEDYVSNINEVGQRVYEVFLAADGTKTPDEYNAIKLEVTNLRDELLTNLNAQFSDRYIFGNTNVKQPPFGVRIVSDSEGEEAERFLTYTYKGQDQLYRTVDVNDITPEHPDYYWIMNDPSFIDVGLGFSMSAGEIIPGTAYNRSVSGLRAVDTGPLNMYDNITRVIKALESGDPDPSNYYYEDRKLIDDMTASYTNAALMLTEIGADTKYLKVTKERLEDDWINLTERQQGLEKMELPEANLQEKLMEFMLNAALQMGPKVLQPSLFQFLR
ncbi:MAG: hypothetical protein FWH02_01845 [Oscillospiraceae bacterium]|nr:hypothetical protein [Oscillospiraceae bacterium]